MVTPFNDPHLTSTADDLGQDEQFERSLYYTAFGTKDKREGVAAFLEKRPPVWKHLE
jgi:enoyl-CoA hydratase